MEEDSLMTRYDDDLHFKTLFNPFYLEALYLILYPPKIVMMRNNYTYLNKKKHSLMCYKLGHIKSILFAAICNLDIWFVISLHIKADQVKL